MINEAEIHRKSRSQKVNEREEAVHQLGKYFAWLSDKVQAWEDLIRLTSDKDSSVRRGAAYALGSAFAQVPDKKQAWEDLIRLTSDTNSSVRVCAANVLEAAYFYTPDEHKKQAWEDLIQLTRDKNHDVRWRAADALGAAYFHISDGYKKKAWCDLIQLTQEKDHDVRWHVSDALGAAYFYTPDEHKKQAWEDLIRLMKDKDQSVRWRAVDAFSAAYFHIPNEQKKQAWNSLHWLTQDNNENVRRGAMKVLGAVYPHIPNENKKQAWKDLHWSTHDMDHGVRRGAADALGTAYSHIPNEHKEQGWEDLIQLTLDKIQNVRRGATNTLGAIYPYIPNYYQKHAWDDMRWLTRNLYADVRELAYYSMGKASIFKATCADSERDFKKEMEEAIQYFVKSSQQGTYSNPAEFCLPFYRSFYQLAFEKKEAEAKVQKYLTEAKSAVGGSENKEKLIEAVENLANALNEVQSARDFNETKSDLNAYRRYCDRACELLDTTEGKAPGASRLIRRGLPIIDERIKRIIAEIQEKANALCKETRGTAFESLGKDVNNAGQNLLNVRDPIGLEKQVQNMLIVLESICTSMPEEERDDACEFLKKANDEHYVEDKLSSINMVLSKIPTHIRKAIVMTKIEIKNSTNTQVALGNGNIQEIRTSTKPEYGLDEPEKLRKIIKSEKESLEKTAISIDEKIQQKNHTIEQILDNWGFKPGGLSYGKREEKKADIEKWLRRFLPSEFEDAFLILEQIQYHDSHTIDGYMEGLSRELKKVFDGDLSGIIFYPLGDSPSSSGGNLLYSYRKNLGLPESSFPYDHFKKIDLPGKKAIVFFDDIIGSGNQAVRFAKKHLQDIKIEKYYVALMAFEKGLEKVRNNRCFKKVIVHEIISEELRAFSPESQVFPDADTRERIKTLCEKYGKHLYPGYPLGFDDAQALIVFPHNTPNNTLPIIWASDKNEKEPGYVWYPVWERIKRTEKKSNK